MGHVVLTYKDDLMHLVQYPSNISRRSRLKKIPGTNDFAGVKAKQLCKWWLKDHGVPTSKQRTQIMFIGWKKGNNSQFQVDWDTSIKDYQSGLNDKTQFWKLKDKKGNLNLKRLEHETWK